MIIVFSKCKIKTFIKIYDFFESCHINNTIFVLLEDVL